MTSGEVLLRAKVEPRFPGERKERSRVDDVRRESDADRRSRACRVHITLIECSFVPRGGRDCPRSRSRRRRRSALDHLDYAVAVAAAAQGSQL